MDNKQLDILQTITLMFRAAAGGQYLNEFMGLVNDSGRQIPELARLLAQTEVFQQRYPDTLSNSAFSIQFVDNAVSNLVDTELKVWAASEIERLLEEGMSRGDVIYWAAKSLAAVNEDDPQWGAAARQFNHQVEISAFYSIDLDGAATSLSVLQRVAALVDENPASVIMAKKILTSGVTGTVIDGYVRGAQEFADLNGDQQLNNGELSAVTDATGNFSLPTVTGFGDLIASGGVDIATGKPFEGIMAAPAGSSVINPLTTVISHIVKNDDISVTEATDIVLAALGLGDEIDLLHFDPIKAAMSANSLPMTGIAMTAHAAAVKVEVITGQVAALLQGIGVTDTEASAISFAYQALAGVLASESDVVDLSARSIITHVIQDAALLAGADSAESSRMGALLADASRTIGNFAQAITALSTSGQSKKTILSKIAAVQIVAETIEGTMQSGAVQGDISDTVVRTTGAQFTKSITAAAAKVGDVNGDGRSDALPSPPSSGGGTVNPPVTTHYLPTSATSFSGAAANDTLSISTAASWTPLVMTAVVLDGGAGNNTLKVQDSSSIAAATVVNFQNLTFDATGHVGMNTVTMTAAQNQAFTGTITAPGTGVNGEEIIIVGDGAVTTLANVENYIIDDDFTNTRTVAITQAANVTAASNTDAVTFNVGALTYSGTITGESTVDDTLSLSNGADVSGGTIANVEALALSSGATVRLSAAQNQGFTGVITAPGTGATGEEITIVGDGAVTTLANIENYVIEDESTNARAVTISQANTSVTATSNTDAVTFAIGAQAYMESITGESTVDDTLSLDNGADVSGGTVANVEALTLASGASVRLSSVQNQNFTGAITAPGTGAGGETITVTGDGAVTTLAGVENYIIDDASTNARTVAITQATNVTATSNTDAITFNIGALAYSGTITGESTVDDILSLSNGADVSGGTIMNVEALALSSGASVRLSVAQNQGFTGAITALGSGVNGEELTIVGDGAVITLAHIENYVIDDDSTNARTVTVTQTNTNVTATSDTDAIIFNAGALTYTGEITGESAVDDTLSLDNGADVSGGTVTNVEALTLSSGASVRLSAAQNQGFTGAITASGTGVNGETIAITGDGAVTTLANIENYIIEDDTTDARTVTINSAAMHVTANSVTDAVTFYLGALTFTGTIVGETTVDDALNLLSLGTGADVSGGMIENVEALALSSGATVHLSAAQNQGFTGAITAPGIGVGGETVMISGDGAVTTLAQVENYVIDDDSTDARIVTVTQANTNVAAASTTDAVTFTLGTLTYTGTLTGESSVDDTLSLSTGADVSGGTVANVEALTLSSGASVRLSVAQNQGFTGAVTASGTGVNGETLTVTGDGAVTTLANVEKYSIEDDSTNSRTVTLSQANTHVTANSVSDAVTFNVGTLLYTGTITGNGTADDTLSLDAGADVSGGTIANVEALALTSGASVRLTAAQNQGFTGAITAPGTGVNGETITIAGDGAVTTLVDVENYIIEDDSTDARTVMISSADTHVTANSITDAVTFYLGALIFNGTIIGEATVDDALNLLSLGTGADVSGGTIENVEALALAAGASVRLSVAQNQGFIGAITAPGTGVNGEQITIVGDGAITTLAEVENYSIDDDATNARTVTISSADTNVTANSVTDAITFNIGALAYTGAITGESTVDDALSLDNGADVSGGAIVNVEALTLSSGASVRLSAAQNQGFTGIITASGTGANGEEITIVGDGAITMLANVENYTIADDSSNARTITITQTNTNVTANSVTDAITFNAGALAYTGTIAGNGVVDDTLSLDNGADVSGGAIVNVEALALSSGASVRFSAAQNQGFTGSVTAPGTGAGGETIAVTGDGAVTTLTGVENYTIADDATDARVVTLTQANTNVMANSASDAVTFNVDALIYTGTITGESSVDDTLSLDNGADVSGGAIANVKALTLSAGASVKLSAAQNQGFTGAVTAPGIGVNGEEITIIGDGVVTTLTNVENYIIDDASINVRTVTLTQVNTNVVANSASDAVTFNVGALIYTGTITGESAADDALSLDNGADVSAGTVVNVEALTLSSGASVRLSVAQNQGFTGTITAPGTGVNGETLTVTGDGAVTTLANVENYSIEDDSTNARNVTILAADTAVIANSVTDAVTFNMGALTYIGTITGESSVDDTVSLSTGADISGGKIAQVEALTLTSGASVRLTAAQNQAFTGTVVAPGSGIGGETLAITGDGAVTTLANVENYSIEDDATNARTVTILAADTKVTAISMSDAVTFNIAALMYTGTITGQGAVDDQLILNNGVDISGGTILNIEALTLASGASVRLSVAQNQAFTGVITAPGSGINSEKITIVGDGAVTVRANIEIYELSDDSTNARTVTLNSSALTLVANNVTDIITVNAAALAQNAALTLGTSASSLIVTNLVGNIVATDLAGALTITTANAADNGISITTGSAACTVNVAAGAASDTVAINAAALGNNTMLTITSGGGAAGAVNIIGLIGNLTVSNPASGAISIAVADNTVDDGIVIAAGAANLAINNVADGDTVTISGFIGSTLIGAIAGISGKFNITAGVATSTITTGSGNDTFIFAAGTGLTSADTVNGGAGTDTVALTGNAAVAAATFDNVSAIETITVTNTTQSIAITTKDTLVAAGAVLTLQAVSLTTGALTFNGAAETGGSFNITGGGANDSITGSTGNDTLSGGNGNDALSAGSGTDTLSGGAGNDTFTFAAVSGLTNADAVDGGIGADTVALTGNTAFTASNDFDNVQNIEAITVGNTSTAVTITTKDALVAAGATLTLSNAANSGALTFDGSAEMDGNLAITGGTGNDSFISGSLNNVFSGGNGDDAFTFVAGTGLTADTVNGGAGTDTLTLTGTTAITAAQFNNVSNIEVIALPDMVNTVIAITTVNALVAAGATLTLSNVANAGALTFNGAAELDGAFAITGGSGNDNITGGSGNDTLAGGDGNDTITAGLGNDTLVGGTGNDLLRFASVTGLTDADLVDGGAGMDTVILTGNTAFLAATCFDNVQNIEAITLGNTSTAVTITTQDALVAAGATLTLSTANTGGMTFNGAAESDGAFTITSSGLSNDAITGGSGADTIAAGTGTDTVLGGDGNDTFTFAAGTGLTSADTVNGGAGTDTVALTGNSAVAAATFDNVSAIEIITVTNTTQSIAITTKDTLVAAGAVLTLQAVSLTTGALTFNGAAETDGSFNITGGGANDSITGSSGNDTLNGGNGNDSLSAGLGVDTLSGGAGNDTFAFAAVSGLTNADGVDGGTGTDTVALTGNTAFTASNDFDNVQNIEAITVGNTSTAVTITTKDTLVAAGATLTLSNAANSGALTFDGSAEMDGNLAITGGTGNDSFISGSLNNIFSGGNGDDAFAFVAGTGLTADTVNGGAGVDTLTLTGTTAVTAAQFNNVSNIEVIALPDMVNTVIAITTVNALVAAGATLTLSNAANAGVLTFNGAAELDGAFGITGGSGNDNITGGSGNDTLAGGDGNDTITAGIGNDTLSGGNGDDIFTLAAGTGLAATDNLNGGTGTDTIALTGNAAVTATNFDNASNIEVITVTNTTQAVTITTKNTLVAAGAILTFQATSLTTAVLTFNGAAETDGAFTITGGGANDSITGSSGNDTLSGGNGNDGLTAGLGDDVLAGDAGNDTLRFAAASGLTSADIVDGGAGTDTVALTGNTAFTASIDFDNVQNIEAITLGNTSTVVTITTQNALVAAGAILTLTNAANSGTLTFNGNAETDGAFAITGGTGNDVITGGTGNDTISGGTGNDTLIGGAGNDSMSSGAGSDSLTGNGGADVMVLGASANDNIRQTVIYSTSADGAVAGGNSGADSITQFDANANTTADDLIQITGALKTALNDDADGTLDYSASNGADLGNQVIAGGANQEATVLLDAEIELVLADFTTVGLVNVLTELGEEINFSTLSTGEEHLFIINFSATQAALVLYTAGTGGDDSIIAADIQILGIVTHNDATGLAPGNVTF